jgi:hypothetical protein
MEKAIMVMRITVCAYCVDRSTHSNCIVLRTQRTKLIHEESVNLAFLRSERPLLVTANVVPSSTILLTLMIEALSSSETSILTTVTRHIPEDGILDSHRRENLKSYIALTG